MHFLPTYFWHGLHWRYPERTMPHSLKGLPSAETEIHPTLVPKLKNGLKLVGQQNQDACMKQICFVMLLDSKLDFRSRTSRIGPMINLISILLQQHHYFKGIFDASQVNCEESITTYTFRHLQYS